MVDIRIIGKIVLSEEQRRTLVNLGVNYIANDNPKNREDAYEIIHRIGNAEAIIVNISTHITEEIIKQCKHLKFIQTWSTGVDNIDIKAAQEAGIIVKNVSDYSVDSVAEKTLSLLIFIANQMREANKDALMGNWNYTKFQGVELKGKTLGIFGKGKIGCRVAELAQAFGMKVKFVDSTTSKEEIYEICAQSDFITLHCPLTKNTYHLLDKKVFQAMKKGVYLVNNSRGGVIDEAALLNALDTGIVSYASMDVFEHEGPSLFNALVNHPKVFVTPHIAWHTKEAVQRLTDQCIINLKQYLLTTDSKLSVMS